MARSYIERQLGRASLRGQHVVARGLLRAPHRRFMQALSVPQEAQEQRLAAILARNEETAFARDHSLKGITSLAEYKNALPPQSYEDHEPYLKRAVEGETAVLTAEEVIAFELTSGSTGANKMIPFTRSLLAEFQAGIWPWFADLLQKRPKLRGRSSYWSISAMARAPEPLPSGITVGLEDDTAYFGPVGRRLLAKQMAVPPSVAMTPDMASCRFETARHLLNSSELGFISIWSPTFLTLLVEAIESRWEELLDTLPKQRATYLRNHGMTDGRLNTARIWPELELISCWKDASARTFVGDVHRRFPQVELQGKGLLTTEGIISTPMLGHPGAVLAITSHVLEFLPVDKNGTPVGHQALGAHELDLGAHYTPLLTTSAGLYRYALGDVVRVVGRLKRTPLVEFIGRADGRSDLCGEKLSPVFVEHVLAEALKQTRIAMNFAMLVPEHEPRRYLLVAEPEKDDVDLQRLADRVDALLREGFHYDQCRRLGQLASVAFLRTRDGKSRYEEGAISLGMKAGDIKPTPLHTAPGWRQVFGGEPGTPC